MAGALWRPRVCRPSSGTSRSVPENLSLRVRALQNHPYIASSTFQKSVRRGDLASAIASALVLGGQDLRSFLRRALVVALEDVGVASPCVVQSVFDLRQRLHSIAGADRVDELAAAASWLADAPKCRGADLLYTAVTRLPANRVAFERLWDEGPGYARRFLLSPRSSLEQKAIAAYVVAGIRKPKTRFAPRLQSHTVWRTYLELGASEGAVDLCEAAYRLTSSGLALLLPLVAAANRKEGRVVAIEHGPIRFAGGIPLYALDRHTRVGKAAIADWRAGSDDLRRYSLKAVALSVFYTEGGVPARQYHWAETDYLSRIGQTADFASAGVSPSAIRALLEISVRQRPTLDRLRRHHLRSSLQAAQYELFSTGREADGK